MGQILQTDMEIPDFIVWLAPICGTFLTYSDIQGTNFLHISALVGVWFFCSFAIGLLLRMWKCSLPWWQKLDDMGTYGTLQEGYPVILEIMLPTKMLAEVGELEVVLLTSTCIHESVLRLQNRALAREACPCMNCHMAVNQNCVWNVPWCSRRMERDDM